MPNDAAPMDAIRALERSNRERDAWRESLGSLLNTTDPAIAAERVRALIAAAQKAQAIIEDEWGEENERLAAALTPLKATDNE